MAWSQEEIKAEYARLLDRRTDAMREAEIVQAEMRVLHVRCNHPDAYTTSSMGESGARCPDCGFST